jgi:uncharacterized membrane protein YGL010W
MESVEFYRSYHTHPINKLIHLICIPMIVLTTINFMSRFFIVIIKNNPSYFYLGSHKITKPILTEKYEIIPYLYIFYYYLFWNLKIGFTMHCYILFLMFIGRYWRENDKNWLMNSFIIFGFAWGIQFVGHAIEGNKPALLTSLSQAVFQAPLFTLEYIYPSLLN